MMTKLESAMNLLERSAEVFAENPPDAGWFRDYFLLTGEHMILVDESWEPGSSLAEYRKEDAEFQPDDEVNVPDEASKLRTILANPCSDEEYEKARKRLNEMSVASPSLAEEAAPQKCPDDCPRCGSSDCEWRNDIRVPGHPLDFSRHDYYEKCDNAWHDAKPDESKKEK